jgi:hypothetical protein
MRNIVPRGGRHKPGGPKHIADITKDIIADLRFQRDVERLWQLGPRAIGELLLEASRERMLRSYFEGKVAEYAAINPDALAVTGGDHFPPLPIRSVGQ